MVWVLLGLVAGGAYGAWRAKTVEMTKMPELVAFFHSMIGLAAVFIAVAAVLEAAALLQGLVPGLAHSHGQPAGAVPGRGHRRHHLLRLGDCLRQALAAPTSSACSRARRWSSAGQHKLNLLLGLLTLALGLVFTFTGSWPAFFAMLALSFVMGVLIIIPIGGADMPVVVSMLNSYSGWAAAGIGFSLNNSMLIIAGSLVGSSGAILSYIMCKAMNRSFFNVILGGFGGEAGPAAAVAGRGAAARSRAAAPTMRPSCCPMPRP